MRRAYIFLTLGIWLAILPYLGFPISWKDFLTTLCGFGIIYLSFVIYKESKIITKKEEKTFENFSENKFENKEEIKDQTNIKQE